MSADDLVEKCYTLRGMMDRESDNDIRESLGCLLHEITREIEYNHQQFRILTNLMKQKHETS